MPRSRTIHLSNEEEETLRRMKADPTIPKRARQRVDILLLSAHHMSVVEAKYIPCSTQTILDTFHRWWLGGRRALFDEQRPGPAARLSEEDVKQVELWLEEDPKTYTSQQLAEKLKTARGIELSTDRLRRILKKRV